MAWHIKRMTECRVTKIDIRIGPKDEQKKKRRRLSIVEIIFGQIRWREVFNRTWLARTTNRGQNDQLPEDRKRSIALNTPNISYHGFYWNKKVNSSGIANLWIIIICTYVCSRGQLLQIKVCEPLYRLKWTVSFTSIGCMSCANQTMVKKFIKMFTNPTHELRYKSSPVAMFEIIN